MNIQSLIEHITAEIEVLTQVRNLLTGSSSRKLGRPAKATTFAFGAGAPRKRRHLSAAGRAAISAAQTRRWAALRKAAAK